MPFIEHYYTCNNVKKCVLHKKKIIKKVLMTTCIISILNSCFAKQDSCFYMSNLIVFNIIDMFLWVYSGLIIRFNDAWPDKKRWAPYETKRRSYCLCESLFTSVKKLFFLELNLYKNIFQKNENYNITFVV